MQAKSMDIFCQVIDNFGDIGVCYRLYREMDRLLEGTKLRLIVDDVETFYAICPEAKIHYCSYADILEAGSEVEVADLVIEAFGCEIPKNYLDKAYKETTCIINLEYFSAEPWTEDFHLQESILPGNCRKFFFMPGLSPKTGGILCGKDFPKKSLEDFGIDSRDYDLVGTLFSYERDFKSLLEALKKTGKKVCLCILGEKSQTSIRKSLGNFGFCDKIQLKFLPFYKQEEYESLLALCDFNLVRGEDSFARALLMGRPFLWHIYPQEENLHLQKLQAFLEEYCPENKELQSVFLNYNQEVVDYAYFFDNLSKIQKKNEEYALYLEEQCNLGKKLKQFIEKI